jgi:hypothetical protein
LVSFVKTEVRIPEEVMKACKPRGRKKNFGGLLKRISESVTGCTA